MLVRREAYLNSGGHAVIRDAQPEDTLLAATIKRWGGKVGVALAGRTVRVRIYRGYRDMRNSLVRKMRIQAANLTNFLKLRLAYVLLQEVLPFPIALVGFLGAWVWPQRDVSWGGLGLVALAAYVSCTLMERPFRRIAYMAPMVEWLHPLGGCLRAWFIGRALRDTALRKSLVWRGRTIGPQNGG